MGLTLTESKAEGERGLSKKSLTLGATPEMRMCPHRSQHPAGPRCPQQGWSSGPRWTLGKPTPAGLTQPGAGAHFLLETLSGRLWLRLGGTLSHRRRGRGRPPLCPLRPHPVPHPGATTTCPPSRPAWPQTRKEREKRKEELVLTAPVTQERERAGGPGARVGGPRG